MVVTDYQEHGITCMCYNQLDGNNIVSVANPGTDCSRWCVNVN